MASTDNSSASMDGVRANLHAKKRVLSETDHVDPSVSLGLDLSQNGANAGQDTDANAVKPQATSSSTDGNVTGQEDPTNKQQRHQVHPSATSGQEDNADGRPKLLNEDPNGKPELLNEDHRGTNPFPGAGCVTVAKLVMQNRNVIYVNRYGPERYPWFVLSDQPHLRDNVDVTQLIDISNKNRRVLDHPIDKEDPEKDTKQFKASAIQGLLGLVWKFDESEAPMEAIEALNPSKVKKADDLDTDKARRAYVQTHKNRLPAYPWTWVWVAFNRPVTSLVDPDMKILREGTSENWELASKYKDCYRKNVLKTEWHVYRSARQQAERFLKWYNNSVDAQTREGSVINTVRHKTEDRRLPTVQPLSGLSSRHATEEPEFLRERTIDADRPMRSIEEPSRKSDRFGDRGGNDDTSGSRLRTPIPSGVATSGGSDEKQKRLKGVALQGYKMGRGIRGDLNDEQQEEFDLYYAMFQTGAQG